MPGLTNTAIVSWAVAEIERLGQDLRFAARSCLKNPIFTLAVVVSLALGIGATCAFFSFVYGVLINPYVYKDANRIIVPTFSEPDSDGRRPTLYYALSDFTDMQKEAKAFQSMIVTTSNTAVTGGPVPRNANVLRVSSNYFNFFGTPTLLGRAFLPGDVIHPESPPPLAVLGYRFWMKEFNGNRSAVGQDLKLGQDVYKVIGIMPPRFTWFDTDVFTLQPIRPQTGSFAWVFMRLRSGVSLASADAELQSLTERAARLNPTRYPKPPFQMHAVPLETWLNGKGSGKWLILMTAVSMLLLIACGNVSVLLLARGESRTREIAMRFALGASAARIVHQLLTETLLLASAGFALGILLAWQGLPAMLSAMPENSLPREAVIGLNVPVLVFAILVSLVTGVLVGLAPALSLARDTVYASVKSGDRTTGGGRSKINPQTALIVAEIGLSALLLVCSAAAIRNLLAVNHADIGYNPRNVAVLHVNMARHRTQSWEERRAYYQRLERALTETPGVLSVAGTLGAVPPALDFELPFSVPGIMETASAKAAVGLVGSGYFKTLQTSVLVGRAFDQLEAERGAQVGLVNEAFARRLSQNGVFPVGVQIELSGLSGEDGVLPPTQTPFFRVIGVVSTIENQSQQQSSKPAIYIPYTHILSREITFLVRTRGNPQMLENTFLKRLNSVVDAEQPLAEFDTLQHILFVSSRSDAQSSATLFSVFASVAVGLASFGLYSVVSFSVAQRNREFAIRKALGAQSRQVALMILKWMAAVTLAGLALGVLGAFAFGSVLAYYEQGWQPYDPPTLLAVLALLLLVNITAVLPAIWKAVSVLPNSVLRAQ